VKYFLIVVLVLVGTSAFGQEVPIPCGEKPDSVPVPCFDAKGAIHTPPSTQPPHQELMPLPPASAPIVIPKIQASINTPPTPAITPKLATPDTSLPKTQSSDNSAPLRTLQPTQADDDRIGYAIGQAIGGSIYQARLTHAINKACFDRHSEGWRLPNSDVILCEDWMKAHPRDARGSPSVTLDQALSIDAICSSNPKSWYTIGTGYEYSCKAWRPK